MVLKSCLIALFLLSSFSLQAQRRVGKLEQRIFKQAKQAFAQGNYANSLRLIKKRYNLRDPNTPSGALSLAGFNFVKLGHYKNANRIFSFLIKNRHRVANKKIVDAYKASGGDTDDLPEGPEKLYLYYHFRAEALSQIYIKDFEKLSEKRRALYRSTALMYANICLDSDYDDDSVEDVITRLENFEKEQKNQVYDDAFFASMAWVSWRDKLDLLLGDGTKAVINSTGEGYCIGGGYKYFNAYWEWNLNACYASTTMTAGGQDTQINYFQDGITVNALFVGPGMLYKPKASEVSLGLSLPLVYRKGDYTQPEGFILEDTTILTYGYQLEAHWYYGKFGLFSKFGKISRLSSSIWSLGIDYQF